MDPMSEYLARATIEATDRRGRGGSPGAADRAGETRRAPATAPASRSRRWWQRRAHAPAGPRRPERWPSAAPDALAVGRAGPGPRRGRAPHRRAGHRLRAPPARGHGRASRRQSAPGAAAALVDRDGTEVSRLRAFGLVHTHLLEALGPREHARLLDLLDGGDGARAPAAWPDAQPASRRPCTAGTRCCARLLDVSATRAGGSAAPAVVAGRPAARPAPHRGRRRSRLPLPQPQELGAAGVPAAGRTSADAQPARRRCSSPRPTTRSGALRWCLAEIRRGARPDGRRSTATRSRSRCPPAPPWTSTCWSAVTGATAVELPGLGHDLLDGLAIQHAEAFESWLLSERRRLAAATESILHEAALGLLARGDLDRARDLAVRAAVHEPAGREPPGAADQALPPRRRGRGRPAPVRRLGGRRRARARRAARRCRPARDAGGPARRTRGPRRPRSRR